MTGTGLAAEHFDKVAHYLAEGLVPLLGAGVNVCDRTDAEAYEYDRNLPSGRELSELLAAEYEYPADRDDRADEFGHHTEHMGLGRRQAVSDPCPQVRAAGSRGLRRNRARERSESTRTGAYPAGFSHPRCGRPRMPDTHVVILAAGQGTRMKSRLPKVLHPIAGRPMVEHVLRTAESVSPATMTLIVGHRADIVRERLARAGPRSSSRCRSRSSAPLTRCSRRNRSWRGGPGTVVLLSGDVPLLRPGTLERLVETHRAANAAATVVTAIVERPYGYGRIVRTDGRIARIVEERDASPAERQIREINGGIYAFDLAPLFDALRGIASQNAQGEFYLTDLVAIYRRRKLPVETLVVENPQEIRGINSRTELAEVSRIVRQNKNEELMAAGVTIDRPGHHLHRPGRRDRRRHGDSPRCGHRGTDAHRRGVRDPGARPHRRLRNRRSGDDQQLLPHRWCAGCRWGAGRALCSSAAGDGGGREGAKSAISWS